MASVDKAVIAECEADVSVESRKSGAMGNPRAVRNTLRLASAVVLLAFVLCHLTAHSFLLVSFGMHSRVFTSLKAA